MSSVGTKAIDFGSNAAWGADWKRAKESGSSELALRYEQIMQAQAGNDPAVLQTAIRTQMISAGHAVALGETARQDMLAAVNQGRNYTARSTAADPLAASIGWSSSPKTLTPQQAAGHLLHDRWERGDRKLSIADLWRAEQKASGKA